MFIIFGDKHRTEPLVDGLRRQMKCPKCGEDTTFGERVISKQFRLYFVDIFTHGTHHVLECGGCGATFVTDELRARDGGNDHRGTVLGAIQEAARKSAEVGRELGVGKALEEAGTGVGKALGAAQERVGGLLSRLQGKGKDR